VYSRSLAIVTTLFVALSLCPRATSAASAATSAPATTRATGPAGWEKEIATYEAKDKEHPPGKGVVLFIGSSGIKLWKTLEHDFPDHPVLNRGFGGSQIADATRFADRIIFPYEPKQIFLRAGGNDIHAGKSAEKVFGDFEKFVETVRAKLPETEIVFIALAPAPARWDERDANKALNEKIAAYVKDKPGLKYVDAYDMTLTPDGQAREELFVDDKLHFNAEGYKLLAERVRPFLK